MPLGLLQYHFGGKPKLWRAAVERAFGELSTGVDSEAFVGVLDFQTFDTQALLDRVGNDVRQIEFALRVVRREFAERIAKIKPGAILINIARGAIVDSDALVLALEACSHNAEIPPFRTGVLQT